MEVLSSIIELAIVDPPTYRENKTLRTIARVCKRWKHVVLRSPRLWARIWCFSDGLLNSSNPFEKMRIHLRLSKEAPLFVCFYTFHDSFTSLHSPGASLLTPHLHRLRHLSLRFNLHNLPFIASFLSQKLPSLTHLEMSHFSPFMLDGDIHEHQEVIPPPSLRHVTIEIGLFIPRERFFPNLAPLFSNVTHLNLRVKQARPEHPAAFLKRAQCLKHIRLKLNWEANILSGSHVQPSRVMLPSLTSCNFTVPGGLQLLSLLDCPSLEELTTSCSVPEHDSQFSLSAKAFPMLRTVITSSWHDLPTALLFKGSDFHVSLLDLNLEYTDHEGFNKYLSFRDASGSMYWSSLTTLAMMITPPMIGENKSTAPANTLVCTIKARPNLKLSSRKNPSVRHDKRHRKLDQISRRGVGRSLLIRTLVMMSRCRHHSEKTWQSVLMQVLVAANRVGGGSCL